MGIEERIEKLEHIINSLNTKSLVEERDKMKRAVISIAEYLIKIPESSKINTQEFYLLSEIKDLLDPEEIEQLEFWVRGT